MNAEINLSLDKYITSVWEMDENIQNLLTECTHICPVLNPHLSEKRKKEKITSYIQATHHLGTSFLGIDYTLEGQPFLIGNDSCLISITHSETLHAMLFCHIQQEEGINNDNIKIGVDIEKITPQAKNVAQKFLNPTELALLDDLDAVLAFTLAWAAKETIIKMFGKNLQMQRDIHIQNIDMITKEIRLETAVYPSVLLKFKILDTPFVLVEGIYFM